MTDANIHGMSQPVATLPSRAARRRGRRPRPLPHAGTGPGRVRASGGPGRAWINGREVGGPDPRYLHLTASYD